jgi:diguanylate cyclase (GGDEF)-like protein
MGPSSSRMSAGVALACLFFAIACTGIGAVAVHGVHAATAAGNRLSTDELATATITAEVEHAVDAVYATGQVLALTTDPSQRSTLTTELYDEQIPAVETGLAHLQRIHEGDGPAEQAGLDRLNAQWAALRRLLNPGAGPTPVERIEAAYAPFSQHIHALVEQEQRDAVEQQTTAAANGTRTIWGITGAVGVSLLVAVGLGVVGSRRLRHAMEPALDQVEFADTLQLAGDEDEAHQLLQRHLQRLVDGAGVTILNRNNSADRLEAVTAIPVGSHLQQSLAQAEPRSCLAVRSARIHDEDDQRKALLGCPVCSGCPGKSTCTPLTVGGEVIGSVLVNRPVPYRPIERQQIRDSVAQAAPVLANLRSLSIAELRAATDSLTGLPNKRAVADTLKRMLAQASRTLTPLTLLTLDLDHFKDINDQYGHPVGDQALANVGAALRSAIRDSDFAGRNGGEEFVVMLPGTDIDGALLTAEKIRGAIAEITIPGIDVSLTASVGLATYPEHALSSERLERLADAALYIAKRSGRDRVEVALPMPDPATTGPAPDPVTP